MQLVQCTWPEVEAYLKTSNAAIMAVGATEQHGPMGVIGTDSICAEVIARGVGEAVGAMVGPTLTVGMSEHHMAFPGSMTLRPSTLIALVRDCLMSLVAHGFRRFYFVNGHGGNTASLQAAFFEVYHEVRLRHGIGPIDVRCKSVNWWLAEGIEAARRDIFGPADGSHASASEVAITQFADAANIKSAPLDPRTAPRGVIYNAGSFRARFADGRIGSDTSLATPEKGRRLYEKAVEVIAADCRAFLAEA